MKKEEVYKIIEFNGIYDDKVKKNLKKLIKKYHPDKNKKDKKTIEIIYEVKKELENNCVSYNPKKNEVKTKEKFISEEECLKNIIRLEKIERGNNQELNKLYDNLSLTFKEYREIYRKFWLTKNQFCELDDEMKKIKKVELIKKIVYLILFIFLIVSLISLKVINLIIVILLIILLILWSNWYNKRVKNITNNMKKIINNINKKKKELNMVQEKIKKFSEEIHSLERKNNNVKNDIRFYKNMKD